MKTWLVYPPFADPTQPYGSLPGLKGYLCTHGSDATVVDLNVAAAHALLSRDHVTRCAETIAGRFALLNSKSRLSPLEEMEYLTLAEARDAAIRFLAAEILPIQVFQHPQRFYSAKEYRRARNLTEDALTCTSAAHFPYSFHFNRASHPAVPWGKKLLERYCRNTVSPLDFLYREFISACRFQPGDRLGISLTFVSQIPETFYLLQLIRRMAPGVFTLLGGSGLQQLLRNAPDDVRLWVMSLADAACVYEGEEPLRQLIAALDDAPDMDAATRFERLRRIPNLLLKAPDGTLHASPVHITEMNTLAEPDFSDLDLDRYLAPQRTLLFAPTRGCYWNRCSFCDYGIGRSGLHGYREMTAPRAAAHMAALCRKHEAPTLYLSVDVLSPRFAEALAQELIRLKADILWSCDLRIDASYTPERCALLFQSGLRAVAFGVESGSDRMLTLMRKGITADMIKTVTACFHDAGIATAWMTFSEHPGEGAAQALETVRLIKTQQSMVDLFILGRFGLTSGSEIAATPHLYGIREVFYCRGDDFRLFPLFTPESSAPPTTGHRMETEVSRLSGMYYLDHYPWAGAISTHHSLLYFLKFGQQVFRKMPFVSSPQPMRHKDRKRFPKGLFLKPAFDLDQMSDRHHTDMDRFWKAALAPDHCGTAPLDDAFFAKWMADGKKKGTRPLPKSL